MELTRKEENKIKKISVVITLFSMVVTLTFLILKNIITFNPSLLQADAMEVSIGINSGNTSDFDSNKKGSAYTGSKKEIASQQKETTNPNGDIINEKNSVQELAHNYTETKTNSNSQNSITESNLSGLTEEKGDNFIEGTNGDSKLGFDLARRNIVASPNFTNDTKEEGKVVIEIAVDKDGTVIEAIPSGRGTTTSSALLKAKAKKIAMATKFTANQKIEEQRGTITIIFSFN